MIIFGKILVVLFIIALIAVSIAIIFRLIEEIKAFDRRYDQPYDYIILIAGMLVLFIMIIMLVGLAIYSSTTEWIIA